jgi:hypothetical protein
LKRVYVGCRGARWYMYVFSNQNSNLGKFWCVSWNERCW